MRQKGETWNRPEPGGEKAGRREGMERMAANLVEHGNSSEFAASKARECAIRADRRETYKKK